MSAMTDWLRKMIDKWRGGVVGVSAAAVIAAATPFIATWEGKENKAYYDTIASPPVWTVCYGHTGKYAFKEAVYSDAKCREILTEDVAKHYEPLKKCLDTDRVPVSVQASILELAFNVGTGAACKSTMVKLANQGLYRSACSELNKWVKAGGKTIRGLVNRRNASLDMCIKDL